MYRFDDTTQERLRDACLAIYEHRGAEWWHPHFTPFFATLADPKGFIKNARAYAHDLGQLKMDFAGKRFLDAGSGAGLFSLILALLGASEVYGVDIWEGSLRFSRGVLQDIFSDGLPIKYVSEDAGKMSFPDSYFDAVVCREAISHFRDPYAFLNEAARVLKPGGKLFLSDGNNGCNPRVRSRTYEVWERLEKGPAGQFLCHDIPEPFEDARRRILKESFSTLSPADIESLAAGTFEMNESQVKEAAERFLATGELPDSKYARGRCPVDLETGMYEEQLFSPIQLASYMRGIGIDAKAYAYFSHGRHPGLAAISRMLARISLVSIYFAPTFQVIGTKS